MTQWKVKIIVIECDDDEEGDEVYSHTLGTFEDEADAYEAADDAVDAAGEETDDEDS